jgi:hypothetical protein
VNVIEKEGRKLAKELEKVRSINLDHVLSRDRAGFPDAADESGDIDTELDGITDSRIAESAKSILTGQPTFDPAGRTSVTGTPESSSSGNSSGSSSEKSVRFCLDRIKPDASSPGRYGKLTGKLVGGTSGDGDNNSDTGLSSLHSSSDEGTYEIGTLV